ncbi:ATP-dependent DNA helicase RecG [bacterium]|nr:ATP-dependent DNA helicase RecG [bacterium]
MYFFLGGDKDKDIQYIKGIGPRNKSLLKRKKINNIHDLLSFYPRDYEDRRNLVKIAQLNSGEFTIKGTITDISKIKKGRLIIINVILQDDTGTISLTFFNQKYLYEVFKLDKEVIASGKVEFNFGRLSMVNPDWSFVDGENKMKINFNRIIPLYPLTEGLTQVKMRGFIFNTLTEFREDIIDPIPEEIRERYDLPSEKLGVIRTHFPKSNAVFHDVKNFQTDFQNRLIFDEIFYLQYYWKKRKANIEATKGIAFEMKRDELIPFISKLPFKFTNAQEKVLQEIFEDMQRPVPMNRLLQGDVGSGKTIVSLIAMLNAHLNGYQSAIMVPTEVLAQQHYLKIKEMLSGHDINIEVLYSKMPKKEMRQIKEDLKAGIVHIIIGTHALFSQDVEFNKLGFAVIDEQHRFGVKQRMDLIGKGVRPDVLVMSATPIPRSIAQTVYGDMDYSVIDEMPAGRKIIETRIVRKDKKIIYDYIKMALERNELIYIVYPLIEETEKIDLLSAKEGVEEFSKIFGAENVGLLHGKMKSREKIQIMAEFSKGKIKILVSTTVIEVGIDVSEATLMVIMNSERFGLSQLHQLRGRVGRSEKHSTCLLYTELKHNKRLNIMANNMDGFKIALEDFKLRGPGDILGTIQSGFPMFKLFNPFLHRDIIEKGRNAVNFIFDNYGSFEHEKLKGINTILDELYGSHDFIEVL